MPALLTARTFVSAVADAVFPQRCLVCGRFGAALHPGCLEAAPFAEGPRCGICWTPGDEGPCASCSETPPAFAGLRARFQFTGDVRRALLEAKFRRKTALLAPLAAAAAKAVPPTWHIDAVAPIPLHRARQRQRGYNQAALIADVVAAHLEVPVAAGVLRRTRATPPQAALRAAERATNLLGSFEAGTVDGDMLLVDDITTTGATFEAAARALLKSGATRVYALAIARED